MKQFQLFCICLFLTSTIYCQKKEIRKGISKGKDVFNMYTAQIRKPYTKREINNACESKDQELLYTKSGKYQRYGIVVEGIIEARYISKKDYPAYIEKAKIRRNSSVPEFVKVERSEKGIKFYLNGQLHSIRILVYDKRDKLIHNEILYSPHWSVSYTHLTLPTTPYV